MMQRLGSRGHGEWGQGTLSPGAQLTSRKRARGKRATSPSQFCEVLESVTINLSKELKYRTKTIQTFKDIVNFLKFYF